MTVLSCFHQDSILHLVAPISQTSSVAVVVVRTFYPTADVICGIKNSSAFHLAAQFIVMQITSGGLVEGQTNHASE